MAHCSIIPNATCISGTCEGCPLNVDTRQSVDAVNHHGISVTAEEVQHGYNEDGVCYRMQYRLVAHTMYGFNFVSDWSTFNLRQAQSYERRLITAVKSGRNLDATKWHYDRCTYASLAFEYSGGNRELMQWECDSMDQTDPLGASQMRKEHGLA